MASASEEPARKQQVERAAVLTLARHLGGAIHVDDDSFRDRPDAVAVLADGTRVGVEVVESADERLARGSALFRSLGTAVSGLLRSEPPPYAVTLLTRDGFIADPGTSEMRRCSARAIADLLRAHSRAGLRIRTYSYAELRELGVERINEVMVYPADRLSIEVTIMTRSGGGWSRQRVQDAISSKATKVDAYRAEVAGGPVWLVVVGGAQFASGTFSDCVRDHAYVSAFDRTFYVDAFDRAVFELPTRRSAGAEVT